MTARPGFTAPDAAAAARTLQRCPAASGYGDRIRVWPAGRDPYAREAERVRAIMAAVDLPRDVVTPADEVADEVADGERELRLSMSMRLR